MCLRYRSVVANDACPSCCRMIGTGTPSIISSKLCVCLNPCGCTLFSMPTLSANLTSMVRTYDGFNAFPCNVQNSIARPLMPSPCRFISQRMMIATAPGSTPTVRRRSPLPRRTVMVPADFGERRHTSPGVSSGFATTPFARAFVLTWRRSHGHSLSPQSRHTQPLSFRP